jgi:hypothetical protein
VFVLVCTVPSVVAEMGRNAAYYLDKHEEGRACAFCKQDPCVWIANHDSILAWDTLGHGNLHVDYMPAANIRKKKIYGQVAITIN